MSLLLFLLWESTNFLVFDLFIIPYFSGAENTLGIVRNLANAIVISTIVVVFGTYAVRQENKKSREISEILNNMSDGLIEVGQGLGGNVLGLAVAAPRALLLVADAAVHVTLAVVDQLDAL